MNELCMKVKQLKDERAIIVHTVADPNVDENIDDDAFEDGIPLWCNEEDNELLQNGIIDDLIEDEVEIEDDLTLK